MTVASESITFATLKTDERERDIIGCCFEVSVESSIVRDLVQQHAGVLYQQLA